MKTTNQTSTYLFYKNRDITSYSPVLKALLLSQLSKASTKKPSLIAFIGNFYVNKCWNVKWKARKGY